MANALGITQDGLKTALKIKDDYRNKRPILMPGEDDRLVVPETMLNHNINLTSLEDPLALAMMAARDPEAPMALAAAARLCPMGSKTQLLGGVVEIIGETSKHEAVRECLDYVHDRHFEPSAIVEIRRHASKFIVRSRQQYTAALRENLKSLLDGAIAPRHFVREFFELTEAGNMRHDIRKKLVLSLLLSPTVRPSVKFLMLENFQSMARPVQLAIISGVLRAEPSRHTEIIKEELRYMVVHNRDQDRDGVH
ncbi:MAG: hypothetical protein HOB37_06800 [Rhodospirillaceae bacterium]|nr:hypothetical protein [Rhodospirillaceae bacterium]MBT5299965.1 hypothetical protein [Rhodospirillaceae bacterium]MBT5514131.1 hypothetical protein [Rhodospirillaceae bacterium]MBT6608156.1 hypothetical protein [Rhodospirillaceae bacterium]MBT6886236.1 hypothetical protein [Rhodospirillaceae bacterium]